MTFPLLDDWLPANDNPERPQMILSTVSAAGSPDARTVLLSEFDSQGLYFHTDSRSRKVADIAANPAVALTFLWPGFTRQLVVQGAAEVAPSPEIAAAFEARSPYLKQLAWQNSREFAQLDLDERRSEWASFALPDDPPTTWIGFVVRPTRLTFWSSDPETASRREEFTLVDGGWSSSYLAG
ncbi:MAG: pyridoxine/pyridoxamine 5'-phosphate oxidase [Rhodoglobus sp.]